jgi:hypothetical protein
MFVCVPKAFVDCSAIFECVQKTRGAYIIQKSRNHLKIPGARTVT